MNIQPSTYLKKIKSQAQSTSILSSIFLDDPDLFFRETVEVVNEAVDPSVRGVDLPFEAGLLVVRPRGGQSPIEGKHLFDQRNHPVVMLPVNWIGKVVRPVDAYFLMYK